MIKAIGFSEFSVIFKIGPRMDAINDGETCERRFSNCCTAELVRLICDIIESLYLDNHGGTMIS